MRNIEYRTETAPDGTYDFPIEPGTYRFTATSQDGRFARGEVKIDEKQTAPIPAVLEAGCSVSLEFLDCQTGKPVAGFPVGIQVRLPNGAYTQKEGSLQTSDENGLVHWDGLMPGPTTFISWGMFQAIDPTHPQLPYSRWWRADEPIEWRRIDYAKKLPSRAEGISNNIDVDIQQGLAPIRVFLEKGVKISGTVVDSDGVPVKKGVSIGVVPSNQGGTLTGDNRFTATTDDNGAFAGYLPAGNGVVYNLCAYFWPDKPTLVANAVSEPFQSKPGDAITFSLTMGKGGWVNGKLFGVDGKPSADLKVTAISADGLDSVYSCRIATPDAEGNFKLGPLRPGHYSIKIGTGLGWPLRLLQGVGSKEADVVDGAEVNLGSWTANQPALP